MNTGKELHIFVLLLISTFINAQDYTWTRMYGTLNGNCIDPENLQNHSGYNSNRALELDSKGNAYILGNGGYSLHFDPNEQDTTGTFAFGEPSMFLSKYNCEGDNEWSLLISKAGGFVGGQGLQIINDTVYITCNYHIDDSYADFYFLDTIVNIKPNEFLDFPFRKGCFLSVFASITPSGEVIEKHIFYEGTGAFDNNSYSSPSTNTCINKFAVGQNYRYFLLWQQARVQYPEYDPKQFFLDNVAFGDSIYYTDTCIGNHSYDNYRLCKFDKNLSLIKENILIDSINADGLYPLQANFFYMIKDKKDNLYISGQFDMGGIDTTATKCKIYIDEHCIDLFNNLDTTDNAFPYQTDKVTFIMKFNADLKCEWIEQNYYTGKLMYLDDGVNILYPMHKYFYQLALNETEDTLFFNGEGNALYSSSMFQGGMTFSNGDILQKDSTETSNATFLAALKTDNGAFLWYKRAFNSLRREYPGALTYHKGKIYSTVRWRRCLALPDTVYNYYVPNSSNFGSSIVVTNSSGEYEGSYNLNSNGSSQVSHIRFDGADNMFFTGYVNGGSQTIFGNDTLWNNGLFITRYGKDCPVYSEVHELICAENEYILNQEVFTESGLHQQHLYTENGGDSIVNLWLQVTPLISSNLPTDTNIVKNSTLALTLEDVYTSYEWQDGTMGTTYEKTYTEQGTDTLWVKVGQYYTVGEETVYCEHTDTLTVHIGTSGINEIENNIALYPNPAKKVVYIKNTPTNVSMLEVCDITGKTIKTIDLNKTQSINIDYLKKGVYFVRAGRFVRKLVKQ